MRTASAGRSRTTAQSGRRMLTGLVLLLLTSTGCSVYMAAKQPGEKDLSVLKPGTHRSAVIAELGAPVWSGDKDGNKVDVFAFKQGYSAPARTARALFHGTADVFSLGLWEVFSTPGEAYFSGSDMKLEVTYDSKDLVKATRSVGGDGPLPQPNSTDSQPKADSPPGTQAQQPNM